MRYGMAQGTNHISDPSHSLYIALDTQHTPLPWTPLDSDSFRLCHHAAARDLVDLPIGHVADSVNRHLDLGMDPLTKGSCGAEGFEERWPTVGWGQGPTLNASIRSADR